MAQEKSPKAKRNKFLKFLSILGPGLTTGAADDDPSGIAPILKPELNLVTDNYRQRFICFRL